MMHSVAERGKYFYNYYEYLLAGLLKSCFCCCFRGSTCYEQRLKKLNRHELAKERLSSEIDVVKLLYIQRLAAFIAKLFLRRD